MRARPPVAGHADRRTGPRRSRLRNLPRRRAPRSTCAHLIYQRSGVLLRHSSSGRGRRRARLQNRSRRRSQAALCVPRHADPRRDRPSRTSGRIQPTSDDFRDDGRFAAERSGQDRELANDGKPRRVPSRADGLGFLRRPSGIRLLRRAGSPGPATRQASCAHKIRRGAVLRLRHRRRCCNVGAPRGDTQ